MKTTEINIHSISQTCWIFTKPISPHIQHAGTIVRALD